MSKTRAVSAHADLRVAIAFLDNARDRKPVNYDLSWQGVVNLLSNPEERDEKDGRAFVPAEFGEREYTNREGEAYHAVLRRKNAVETISMAVADYDSGVTPKQAAKYFRELEHVIYSSHSHRPGKPKFRVVLPFAEPVVAASWRSAWLHFRDLGTIGSYSLDQACSDASRLYYLPSHPPGVKPGFRYNPGKLLELPTTEHPDTAPQTASWLSTAVARLNTGCPNITLPEWLSSKGVTFRPKPGAPNFFHLPECPWGSEHSSGTDGWGHAAVFLNDEGRWCFSCCHATCRERGRGWRAFADLVAPKTSLISKEFKLRFGRRDRRA